ncbi:FimV/HubP family polar landmark protein [Brumicola nitratireducens]|uniref:AAA ATPase containing von Willebrand factor type A (VWA) n=1 Tax=Glaciecola nitratireducens (strain JCM 12485 / KCTC 12276 / FR1064) TaxID=1085623 RepID=G4QHS4_GLANF|nr:FimV/HubP family polar landmark protein [Glaciecola nitratireducens]AEP30301.1 AAA ATPase containing von Willebrand factor type A (vWA) [Glaciecola nitratireducens FR1064]
MQWSLLLTRAIFVAILGFSAVSNAVAQGTQIQGPRDAADVYSGVVYGPIDQSDTLWAISGQYRKNQQFTVYQVMLAIYELNPRAFANRNFNTMVNGSMLKLPSDRYIARIDPARARTKAEQDDRAFTQSTGRRGGSANQELSTSPDIENLKPDVPLVNKEELDAAQNQFQQQINSLKRQQAGIVNDFKQQLEQSIQATQIIIDENKVVLDELAKKDEEIVALKTELSEDFQAKLDDQAAQIQELREFVKLTKMKEEAKEESSFGNLIRQPLFIIIVATVAFFLIFVLVALVILRKPINDKEKSDASAEGAEDITLDDSVSHDADELLAILESGDVSDDDLLDDILSDELEESIDEVALDTDDFGDIDDEMLVPDQRDKNSEDDLSDALADLDSDDISLDDDLLDLEGEDIALDDNDSFDLDGLDDADAELEEVDIDSILDEQGVDIRQVEADANKQLRESDEDADDDNSFAESFAAAEAASGSDDEQLEIDIDDLLEQNVSNGDLPEGISLNRSGDIDENIIEQIRSEISEKNSEIKSLTESFEEELANNNFVDDDNADDDTTLQDPEANIASSDQQKSIRPLDELTKGLEDDIADAIANAEDEDASHGLEDQEIDDPLTDELLSELGAEQPDEDIDADIEELLTQPLEEEAVEEEDVEEGVNSTLEDSLNDLQTGTIDFEQHEEVADELEELDNIDIDSVLDDSLNDLLQNNLEADDFDAESGNNTELESASSIEDNSELDILAADADANENANLELDDALLKALDSTEAFDEIELDDIESDILDLNELSGLDSEDTSSDEEQDEQEADEPKLALDDIPSFASDERENKSNGVPAGSAEEDISIGEDEADVESSKTDASADDDLLDLPGLDDWLDDDEDTELSSSKGDSELAQALDEYSETDSEDDVLREIEEADFDSLLEEMGALSDEQTAAEIDKLASDDLDDFEVEGDLEDITPETLDNPDLDLTALFDESEVEDSKDFIDVDSLLQESENLTPATDEELGLGFDMSLDNFLNDEAEIDVDLDADQASNLDLAQVYIDMEDNEAAIEALEDVLQKGTAEQKVEAQALLKQLRG